MKTIRYDKLVRDYIPDIISAAGKTCVVEVLSDEAYLRRVDQKLDEELAEYHADQSVEELERIRADKAAKRGAFAQKLLLREVTEP